MSLINKKPIVLFCYKNKGNKLLFMRIMNLISESIIK